MFTSFKKNIFRLAGDPHERKFLLAVSGGIDSMTMAELFRNMGLNIAIAHCNFGLRGKESDGDEEFVQRYAKSHHLPFHAKRMETMKYAGEKKISIQMAARDLRYRWLHELSKKYKYDFTCIAHNSDDAVETFFINLLRGSGIAGLTGMDELANHFSCSGNAEVFMVIRPLLHFSRREIEEYARQNKIEWREDSSNSSDKYQRNKIRHRLLPLLEELQPHSTEAIHSTMDNLRMVETVYRQAINQSLQGIITRRGDKLYLNKKELLRLDKGALYLYEAVKEYNFNYAQAVELSAALYGISGKIFLSPSHRITVDRTHIILEKRTSMQPEIIYSIGKKTGLVVTNSFTFNFSTEMKAVRFTPPSSSMLAYLDYAKLQFPLTLRRWKKGDRFYPLGMKKQKKVSDLLIDNKVSVSEKEQVYVLTSASDIVWVTGIRIDERYKIAPATKKMYICKMTMNP